MKHKPVFHPQVFENAHWRLGEKSSKQKRPKFAQKSSSWKKMEKLEYCIYKMQKSGWKQVLYIHKDVSSSKDSKGDRWSVSIVLSDLFICILECLQDLETI